MDGTSARGGHAIRARRSQLLPALHAVQDRIGWISQPALNYISRRLAVPPAEAYGVATFYALYATKPRPRSWPTSATTSPAGSPARRGSATTWDGRSGRRARRLATAGSPGCARRAWACATSRRRRSSRGAGEAADARRPGARRRRRRPGPTGVAGPRPRLRLAAAATERPAARSGRRRRPVVARRLPRHTAGTTP